MINRVL